MDFSNFFPSTSTSNNQGNSLIQKDVDREKYEKITKTMYEKRKAIEENLKGENLEASLREAYAFSLMQIKEDMRMFGISEVEYQIYLAKEPVAGSDQPLPFLS